MTEYVQKSGLQVAAELADFAENTLLPGTGVAPADFWAGLADLVARFGPKNAQALKTRDDLQAAMALLKKDVTDVPLSFNNFRD